ncbi:hypothetical protein K504DRAFT_224701 [Pleomassaria siparia CBS 279.74]|uniref:Rhodopsin domain-containing protein n=1 Tax=Pleomassaria siparia CBS 279.74 TaxID=1314801 RepID=A0A6G1KGC3_9PLEO|nr:hypothetical protein K504DRAFT_224701 [Pleomassaria siparia CBS 279.74]
MASGINLAGTAMDLRNHHSNVASIKTANISLIILVGLFVGTRLFVRTYMVRKIFADDVLIVVASAFTIGLGIVCLIATSSGMGEHVWTFPPTTAMENIRDCIQYLYTCQILYACAVAFTKIAIIASYLRFIQERRFRIALYATAVVVLGLWLTGVFVTIFQCHPVASAWDMTISNRTCIDFVDYLYASSSVTILTDIVLCVLPWPYLWALNMPLKQRVILCMLFGIGAGACVASIIRIAKLHALRSTDVTYEVVPCLNLSVIECSLGIICVSIPPLRPLAAALFPKFLRTTHSSSAKSPVHSHNLAKIKAISQADERDLEECRSVSSLFRPDNVSEEGKHMAVHEHIPDVKLDR